MRLKPEGYRPVVFTRSRPRVREFNIEQVSDALM
jgi:hypothetical protein